jgi:hypothetical protein
MMRVTRFICCIGCVGAPPSATQIAAQTLSLRLVDSTNRAPITGAIVRLVGLDHMVAQGLSNEVGRITLRAPAPGTYWVAIDRIGYAGSKAGPFVLSAGVVGEQEIALASRARILPSVDVRAPVRCPASGPSGDVAIGLWEEIHKALTANLITQNQDQPPLQVRQFIREASFGGRAGREWVTSAAVVRHQPFTSLDPEQLSRQGFIFEEGDSTVFAAPDARQLLSDQFIATHCFQALAVRSGDSLLGLGFRPIPNRTQPDVRGVIWVARTTHELRYLEYVYTGLPPLLDRLGLGGRVEFARLRSGQWIVSSWLIRMPRIAGGDTGAAAARSRGTPRLMGYLIRGGRAEPASDTTRVRAQAIIRGRVIDSTSEGGLAGVVIRLERLDSVLSDTTGNFTLMVSTSGPQVLIASHPKLGLLGDPTRLEVVLSAGDTTTVVLAVPSLATFARALCQHQTGGGLLGLDRSSVPLGVGKRDVEVRWSDGRKTRLRRTSTDERGLFALCNPGTERPLVLVLLENEQVVAERQLTLRRGEFRWVELPQ